MRVRATATGTTQSNAIGQLELSCTPYGLALGFYGVGAYSEGYAPGATTSGTRFTVPYSGIKSVLVQGEQVYLAVDAPGLPHDRLTLENFSAGAGVPAAEIGRRRLIVQFSALSAAVLATLAASMLAPSASSQALAWGALGYGALAAILVVALGHFFDRGLLFSAASSSQTRDAFLADLSIYYAAIERGGARPAARTRSEIPHLGGFLPRTAMTIGVTVAATILTALVVGERTLTMTRASSSQSKVHRASHEDASIATSPSDGPEHGREPTLPSQAPSGATTASGVETPEENSTGKIERTCLCDRADSQLWKAPIPKLSGLLIEQRSIHLKNSTKTELKVAVVNNSDTPIEEITVHVQFYERRKSVRIATQERPLYFEGPLAPGAAVKWTTEARGTEFELAIADLGNLGPSGDGAAPAAAFVELLQAHHRPVRLHAARLLSYLGDSRAREAALELKEALRSGEGPYLRRVLSATGDTRVCDVDAQQGREPNVGVCVYNASSSALEGLGIQVDSLAGSLEVDHPLSDPPSVAASKKWKVPGRIDAQSGRYVRVPVPTSFFSEKSSLEVIADRYDLLD